jgi:hypothetical protein
MIKAISEIVGFLMSVYITIFLIGLLVLTIDYSFAYRDPCANPYETRIQRIMPIKAAACYLTEKVSK